MEVVLVSFRCFLGEVFVEWVQRSRWYREGVKESGEIGAGRLRVQYSTRRFIVERRREYIIRKTAEIRQGVCDVPLIGRHHTCAADGSLCSSGARGGAHGDGAWERLGLASSSASRNVAALSGLHWMKKPGLGLVELVTDPMALHKKQVRLTVKGKRLVEQLLTIMEGGNHEGNSDGK